MNGEIGYNKKDIASGCVFPSGDNYILGHLCMKFKKKSAAALAVSAALLCGAFAGCDLITTDSAKDMAQVVAEVNITDNQTFSENYADKGYGEVIETAEIYKRDMIASFLSVGHQYVQQGVGYAQAFSMIMESLTNQQILLQYAKIYFLENDPAYTTEGYSQAVGGDFADDNAKAVAGISYFLTEDEQKKAEYDLKVMFNNTLDSAEKKHIEEKEDDAEYDTARTTPTGMNTANEDYVPEVYEIYTGRNTAASCGAYETVEGSTPYTRAEGYKDFLKNLRDNSLLKKGEKTTDITSLSYYTLEKKSVYENALLTKLYDAFEAEIEDSITAESLAEKFDKTLASQKAIFAADRTSFESELDKVSDSVFVLTAPNENYGFVINILLPFNKSQTTKLNGSAADKQGNKFLPRAQLLRHVKATDQRKTWFTCEDDYSFEAEGDAYNAGNAERKYLFFEDCIGVGENEKYEPLKNYYGKYTYNGTVSYDEKENKYTVKPAEISIDGFLVEMEAYLEYAGLTVQKSAKTSDYYDQTDFYKQENGKTVVDYGKFLYYSGKVEFTDGFNPNRIFDATSDENKAMSVIRELSFAYNTDTAGLNTYFGYAVSPFTTDFVKEFEYAAQLAVSRGAGSYTVVPSDYGWHIMYCTFSYKDMQYGANGSPYTFKADEIEKEGTFSNLYYEANKSTALSSYSTTKRTEIVNAYEQGSKKIYEDRYADLTSITAS